MAAAFDVETGKREEAASQEFSITLTPRISAEAPEKNAKGVAVRTCALGLRAGQKLSAEGLRYTEQRQTEPAPHSEIKTC